MRALFGILAAVLLVVAADLVTATGVISWSGSTSDPDELIGRTFASVTVTEGAQPRHLIPNTRLRVTFSELDGETHVGWSSGCNAMGSQAAIRSGRIRLVSDDGRGAISTLVGCPDELHEQDSWIRGFFEAGPRWELRGERLRLAAQGVVIELVEEDG